MSIKNALLLFVTASLLSLPMLAAAGGGVAYSPYFGGTYQGNVVNGIRLIVNALLTLAGVIAAVFVVIGGFLFITSQGDEEQMVRGRRAVIYAVVGLIIIILSGVLVNLIIGAARG